MVASRVLPLPLAPTPLVSREFDILVCAGIAYFVAEVVRNLFTAGGPRSPLVSAVYRSRLPDFLCSHPSTLFFGDESHSHLSLMQPTQDPALERCVMQVQCKRRNAVVGASPQLYQVLVESLR